MIRSTVVALGALTALTAPALADYYVVHGPDRHCRVVERYTPGDREIVRVGPLSFRDREEAERQIKIICRDGYYREGAGREGRLRQERY